jgi:hypothetical protein
LAHHPWHLFQPTYVPAVVLPVFERELLHLLSILAAQPSRVKL